MDLLRRAKMPHPFRAVLPLFVLCALLAPQVSASTVYDGWVLVGKTITVAGQQIRAQSAVGEEWEKLSLETGEGDFIIDKGDCRRGSSYVYCYTESRYEIGVYGEWDYVTRTATPEVHLTVSDISPLITVSASLDKSSLAVNDQATVTVKVKNTGSLAAAGLAYTAELPDSVLPLLGSSGVSISGRTVTWKGTSVSGGGEKEFTYTFRVKKAEAISFGGNLTYDYERNTHSKSHPAVSATVRETVKVATFSLSAASASINEEVTLTALITNADPEYEARIRSFALTVPGGLEAIKKDSALSGTGTTLKWEGTIPLNSSKSFEVVVRTVKSGTYKFSSVLDAEVYSTTTNTWLRQNSSTEQTLSVKLSALAPSIEFVLGKSSVDGGEQTGYRVYLNNPDTKATYMDITYTLTSELSEGVSDTVGFIVPATKKLIFSDYFNAPISAEKRGYPINFSGSYRTQNDERFTFGTAAMLTVSEAVFQQLIELTRVIPESIQKGSSAEVILTVRNLQENDVRLLKLADTVTGARIASGASSGQIGLLGPNTEVEAYRYTISVPADSGESAVVVKTKAEFDYRDGSMRHYTQYAEGSAALTGPEGEEEPEQWAAPPSPPQGGTPAQPEGASQPAVEEEGFFARLITSIREFLRGIF